LCCVRWDVCTKRYRASFSFVLVDLSLREEKIVLSLFSEVNSYQNEYMP